jgi:hypothetical protein
MPHACSAEPTGASWGPYAPGVILAKARKVAGIDHAHFHDLRRAGLTMSAQVGETLAEVLRPCRPIVGCGRDPVWAHHRQT